MRRLLVTDKGDCFARFHNGSTVFLSSSCHIVVETDTNNKQITHVIHFINDSLKQKVAQIVNIRNEYYSSICLPPFMKQTKGQKLLSPLTECIWNQECQQNIQNQTIQSNDGHTALKLQNNQHTISISFPLYINKEVTVTPNGSSLVLYHHIQQTQIQSVCNHNLCWDFPLSLIGNQTDINPNNLLNVMNKIRLPQIKEDSLQKTIANLSEECMKAIEYFHCLDHGIPPHQMIVIEWTVDVVHRIFNCPTYLIESFVSFDDSYLVSNNERTFLYHYIPIKNNNKNESLQYIYSVKAIPPIPPDTKQESSYNLNLIAQNALNLLQNAYSLHSFKQTKTSKNMSLEYKNDQQFKLHSMSNKVKNYYIHPKFGEFTYFEDKRVKISFSDRTMLELNGDWKTCSIITKYGEEMKNIDCIQPIQAFAHYIKHAINYANWCCLSKEQQINHQREQIKLQNDIQNQINFSKRLVETQRITHNQDFTILSDDDINIDSNIPQNGNIENTKLIESIQDQLNDIDKLLQ